MRNWMRLILVVSVVLLFQTASAIAQTASTTKTFKSPNGKHALKVDETVTIEGRDPGPGGRFMRGILRTMKATGIAIAPDGATSEQWQWTGGTFPVAGALVADSGKLFVLLTDWGSGEPPPSLGPYSAPRRTIVMLDDKGKSHATVTLDNWWKALGAEGKISPDNPPELRFLENEKILEIKLASGKTARVNTDSGELTVEKGAATAPATVPATSPTPLAGPGGRDGGRALQGDGATTRTWKSPNGQHALRVEETITTAGADMARGPGPKSIRSVKTHVTGLAIAADGTTREQWQWSQPLDRPHITFEVADALVADSGKLIVMIGRYTGQPPVAAFGPDFWAPVIVIVDDKGKTRAQVMVDDWWAAFGPDGKATSDNISKLRFLEDEKILEIKLASGKTARVNTDSGELTVEKAAGTAPATAPATSPATRGSIP